MRINNLHLTQVPWAQTGEAAPPTEGKPEDAERGGSAIQAGAAQASFHTPSAEWTAWLTKMRQELEVRPEVVQRIVERLQSGFYFSSASAENVAKAILQANE